MGQEQSSYGKSYGPRSCPTRDRIRERARAPRSRRVERPVKLADATNETEFLEPKIRPYVVRESQNFIEDVTIPFEQTIYQPIVQPVFRQARPVLDTFVKRRVQPVVTQTIVPRYQTVVRDGPPAPVVETPPVVEEERLEPIIRRVQSQVYRGVDDECPSDEYLSEDDEYFTDA